MANLMKQLPSVYCWRLGSNPCHPSQANLLKYYFSFQLITICFKYLSSLHPKIWTGKMRWFLNRCTGLWPIKLNCCAIDNHLCNKHKLSHKNTLNDISYNKEKIRFVIHKMKVKFVTFNFVCCDRDGLFVYYIDCAYLSVHIHSTRYIES